MNILTSSYTLDLAGMPTFTLTMYKELVKRGHKVVVYSPFGGGLAKEMNTISNLEDLPTPDIIIAQHTPCAQVLKAVLPKIPFVFYSHGLVQEIEQPPDFPCDHYFVINEECQSNLESKSIPSSKITIIRDFIDTTRFFSTKPINQKLTNVLFISNYKKWRNFFAVDGACKKLGLNLRCCGAPYGRNYEIEKAINEADLVVSWARGIMEAMACERAVLSFDRNEGDGYIDPINYFEGRKDNFSGRVFHYPFNADTLSQEMQKYDPNCGKINRDLILKYHNVVFGVDQILETLKKLI